MSLAAIVCAAGFANPALAAIEPTSPVYETSGAGVSYLGSGSVITVGGADIEYKLATPPDIDSGTGGSIRIGAPGKIVVMRGASDLSLWSLLSTAQAQQEGKVLDLVDATATNVKQLADQVSPVPLPGVVWLFLSGLFGLFGTRLRGGRRAPASMGGPVAA
jgi:hypothetical protein